MRPCSFLQTAGPASAILLAAAAFAACGDGTGPRALRTVSLSVATSTDGAAVVAAAPGRLVIEHGPDVLVITRARVVLREIELESSDDLCAGEDRGRHDDDDHCEIEFGPRLVDLPLDGSTRAMLNVEIPEGVYEEIELELHKPDDDDAEDRAFLAVHPDFRRVSVRVEGTFNGEPFVYTSDINAELELEFEPPLVVGAPGVNITVDIGLAGWFRGADGRLLRPSTGNADPIDANIRASFRAFEDDDRDGDDDHS